MCEYNLKNPIWDIFLRKGPKKEYEFILKNVVVEFEFKSWGINEFRIKNLLCGGLF